MLFQCSARLTLIWLSGSALLPCQPVRAMVKLFEGGWRQGGSVFVPSRDEAAGMQDQASVPRLSLTGPPSPSLYFTPAGFSFPASAPPVAASFLLPLSLLPSFTFLGLKHSNTHTWTHFLLFLSEASLKELWLCGLEGIETLCLFVGFSPNYQNTTLQWWLNWAACDIFFRVSLEWATFD